MLKLAHSSSSRLGPSSVKAPHVKKPGNLPHHHPHLLSHHFHAPVNGDPEKCTYRRRSLRPQPYCARVEKAPPTSAIIPAQNMLGTVKYAA
jgi:hypothetical protein